jgi:hypothetical protein
VAKLSCKPVEICYVSLYAKCFSFRFALLQNARDHQQLNKKNGHMIDRELTDKHFPKTSFGKMNVQKAVDVFSEAIEKILLQICGAESKGKMVHDDNCRHRFPKFRMHSRSSPIYARGQDVLVESQQSTSISIVQ